MELVDQRQAGGQFVILSWRMNLYVLDQVIINLSNTRLGSALGMALGSIWLKGQIPHVLGWGLQMPTFWDS